MGICSKSGKAQAFLKQPFGIALTCAGAIVLGGGLFAAGAASRGTVRKNQAAAVTKTVGGQLAVGSNTPEAPPAAPTPPEPIWVSAEGVSYTVEPAVLAFLNDVQVSCAPQARDASMLDFLKMRVAQGGSRIQQQYRISQGSTWESGTEVRVYEDVLIPGTRNPEKHNAYYYIVSATGVKRLDDPASAETNSDPYEHPLGFMLTHRTAVCSNQWSRERAVARAEAARPEGVDELPADFAAQIPPDPTQ